MSAPQAAGAPATAVSGAAPYWRSAGLSYVAYANLCAVHLRKYLKEPFKTKIAKREEVHYKFAEWDDGVNLQYTEEGLFTVDEHREGGAAAFGDDIAIGCLANEFGREIFV